MDSAANTLHAPEPFVPPPEPPHVAYPEVQTGPATPPVGDPFFAAPPPPQPIDPAIPNPASPPPPPAIDEPALRAREEAVEQREAALDARLSRRREVHATNLTDKDVEGQIIGEYAVCAFDAIQGQPNITPEAERALRCVTMVVLITRSGFPVIGTAACSAPENYDPQAGRKWAKADAMSKLWFGEEYAMRQRLMGMDVPPEEAL